MVLWEHAAKIAITNCAADRKVAMTKQNIEKLGGKPFSSHNSSNDSNYMTTRVAANILKNT
jgi:hypothetical protein